MNSLYVYISVLSLSLETTLESRTIPQKTKEGQEALSKEATRLKEAHKHEHLKHFDKDTIRREKIRRLFELYDTNNNGGLEFTEFEFLLKDLCIPMKDSEAAKNSFEDIDTDQNHTISLKELTDWYLSEGKSIKKRNKFASMRLKAKKRLSMSSINKKRAMMSLLKDAMSKKSVTAHQEFDNFESQPKRVVHDDHDDHHTDRKRRPSRASKRTHRESRISPAVLEHPPGILSKPSSNSLDHAQIASIFDPTQSPIRVAMSEHNELSPPGIFHPHSVVEKETMLPIEDKMYSSSRNLPLRRNLALYLQHEENKPRPISKEEEKEKKKVISDNNNNNIPRSDISITFLSSFKISQYMNRVLTRRRLQTWIQEMDACTSRGDVVTMQDMLRCHGPTWSHLRPLMRERVYGTDRFVNALVNLRFPCYFNSFLHSAVRSGSKDAVEMLLELDADVESRDADLRTPLHVSVLAGDASLHISDILLAHVWRSDESVTPWILSSLAKTSEGLSVLDVAQSTSCKNDNTVQWLLSNGACSALMDETTLISKGVGSSSSSTSKTNNVEEEEKKDDDNDPIFQYYFSEELSSYNEDRSLKPQDIERMLSLSNDAMYNSSVYSSSETPTTPTKDVFERNNGKIYDFEKHVFMSSEARMKRKQPPASPAFINTSSSSSSSREKKKNSQSPELESRFWISDSASIRSSLMQSLRRKRLTKESS